MILQRLLRPQLGLRAVPSSRVLLSQTHARSKHTVPRLTHQDQFVDNGIPGLLSPAGFDMAWTQYQSLLVDKLNEVTAGTEDQNMGPSALLVKYARDASNASIFNYASMAHNNHFFFNCIAPEPVAMPQNLAEAIDESCSSVESLKQEFLATANAMFGPGFVWLVKSKDRADLKILCTYIAGSPYPAAHFRQQPVDMATQTTGVAGGENPFAAGRAVSRTYGSMGRFGKGKVFAPNGADVHPILCVNTWEHVWLRDYGIAGKPGYLEAWWDRINWEEVAQNYNQIETESVMGKSRPKISYTATGF